MHDGKGDITQHYVVLDCKETTILFNVLQSTASRGYVFDVYNPNWSVLV